MSEKDKSKQTSRRSFLRGAAAAGAGALSLVDTPLVFSYADLERFPRENHVYFCECAANTGMEWAGAQLNGAQFTHGMIHNMEYTGVPLRTLLEEAGLTAAGDLKDKWVFVEGADASSNGRSIPMEKALDDVLVAFKANGEALRKEHGYPVRTCGSNGSAGSRSWTAPSRAAKRPANTRMCWTMASRANGHGRWMPNPS